MCQKLSEMKQLLEPTTSRLLNFISVTHCVPVGCKARVAINIFDEFSAIKLGKMREKLTYDYYCDVSCGLITHLSTSIPLRHWIQANDCPARSIFIAMILFPVRIYDQLNAKLPLSRTTACVLRSGANKKNK